MGQNSPHTPRGIKVGSMTTSRIAAALAGIALTFSLAACGSADDAATGSGETVAVDAATLSGHVDPATFLAAATEDGVTVIDVRTPAEFEAGHLPNAININVEDPAFAEQIAQLDTTGTYAIYCRSANRSRVAEEIMLGAGFENVFGLEGGVTALDAGELVTN